MNISKPLVQIIDTIVKFMFLLALFSDNVLCTFFFFFFSRLNCIGDKKYLRPHGLHAICIACES